LAKALHDETEGNPFFLRELLLHLARHGVHPAGTDLTHLTLPESLRDAIARRFDHLSDRANRALSVAAVVGSSFSLRLLEAVPDAAHDPDELLDALDEAVNARVLVEDPDDPSRYSFAHNLIRHALLAELTTARRIRLHRRIGEAIEALPDRDRQIEALAYHFAEAALDSQVAKAARYALDAGRHALQRLAFEEAASLLERGLAALELEDDEHRDRSALANLLLVLAEARAGSGDAAAARQLALRAAAEARAVRAVEQLSQAAVVYARLVPFSAPNQSVVDLCDEALAALAPLGDQALGLRARVLAALGHHRARADGDYDAAGRLAEEAARLAERAGDPATEADALVTRIEVLMPTPCARERLDLAGQLLGVGRRAGDVRIRASGLYHEALARLTLGDVIGFDSNIAEIERLASRLHLLSPLEVVEDFGTMRALLDGRFSEAEAMIDAGLAAELSADSERRDLLGGLLLVLYRELGRLDEVAPLLMAAARAQPTVIAYRAGAALVLAELGRDEEAIPEFESVMATCAHGGLPQDTTRVVTLYSLSEAAAILGIAKRADELYALFAPYEGQFAILSYFVCYGTVDRYLGMLASLSGRWEDAERHFDAALAMEEHAGALPLALRTKYWFGRSLMARGRPGDRDRADQLLTGSRQQAVDLGMAGLVRQIDQLSQIQS
jgi:tetratricopeptide (TPR) repeat protein